MWWKPYLPIAPYRGLILRRLHHRLKPLHRNCPPLSVTVYFGTFPILPKARPRNRLTWREVGCFRKTETPITRLEKWSNATPIHQQNGQTCGSAFGGSIVKKPRSVGMIVRSTLTTWAG